MRSSNWMAITIVAVVVVVLGAALWFVFVDRDEAPGVTGALPGSENPATATPVTPETPGRTP